MRISHSPVQIRKSKLIRRITGTIILILLVICLINILNWLTEDDGVWKPDYPKADLGSIAEKEMLSEEEYQTVFLQTGLGKAAVDAILLEKDKDQQEKTLEKYQDNFFSAGNYECRQIAIIVYEEKMRDKEGNLVRGFEVADLRDGDILITKATHSLGWRHGHAAIVTNAAKGETLEAILLGNPSILQNVSKWRTYPSFIQLRLKGGEAADPAKVAEYAKKEILGLPYGLLTGIPDKAPKNIIRTQCSHLVWYPYHQFGIDLDSDGSWLVTPNDIANSDLLEVVQVYGVNPEEIWP